MDPSNKPHIALLYPGDRDARQRAAPEESRFLPLFEALAGLGVTAEPAVYHDDFREEVHRQLARVDGALVWMNPIQDGRTRSVLDAMLREGPDRSAQAARELRERRGRVRDDSGTAIPPYVLTTGR